MDFKRVFSHVDHTALAACTTWEEVSRLCDEAEKHGMASVCIPPSLIKAAKQAYGDRVILCTVIGFPLGYSTSATKVFETKDAIADGADEIDMVVNLGWVKEGRFDKVESEIAEIKKACGGKLLKVIVETCCLTEEEKIRLCNCVSAGGADFIKTSTGFGTGGATIEDIRIFKSHIAPGVKVKASGGIRTYDDFVKYLDEGCERLGTSSAIKVYEGKL